MGKFDQYNIQLKDFGSAKQTFEYLLENDYFAKINSPEVQKGILKAMVIVVKKTNLFELKINIDGKVLMPCDRCLDEMEQPIHAKDTIQVKLGDSFSEEGDVVIIPETDGAINIAWFLYEIIVLNIPLKHIHQPGECNKMMVVKLKKHLTHKKIDDEDGLDDDDVGDDDMEEKSIHTDPRWDGLKNIFDN